ncbi:MAG: suppressor of fused domain protein [Eubacterium sp.]|nr:suppressor of fused domain protein [Eubacterium sp.]
MKKKIWKRLIHTLDEEPFYKLVTMGAGAYEMNIPDKWKEYNLERAEYVMYVPKDWDLQSKDMKDYWPIKVLKDVARLPIWCDTWLSFGHTTQSDEEGTPYASNTRFNSVILDFCENHQGDVRLKTSSGKTINFYQVIPLYPEELKFKLENDAETLIDMFGENEIEYKVVDINRKSAIK